MNPKQNGKTVYVFSNSYKPVLGGIQTVASQFAEGCKYRGFHTVVVTSLYPRHLKVFEKISGVPVLRLPFAFPDGQIRNMLMFGISFIALFFLFLCERPDYIYVHFPLSQSSCLTALHRIFKFKLIASFHGHDVLRYDEGYSKATGQYRAQKNLLSLSVQITACSNYLAHCVQRIFDCKNVLTVYNGVDLARFSDCKPRPTAQGNGPYLFAWGRLEEIKGFDLLIKAFANSKRTCGFKLLLAGDGSQRESLQRMIDEYGLKNNVVLIGILSPDEVVQYAQNSEINVIPSRREPFGIVALEAIAAKRPIIATNGGGLSEIMSDKYGLTVPVDADEIGKAIDRILSGEVRFDFSDTEEYLSHFSIPMMVEKYISLSR